MSTRDFRKTTKSADAEAECDDGGAVRLRLRTGLQRETEMGEGALCALANGPGRAGACQVTTQAAMTAALGQSA